MVRVLHARPVHIIPTLLRKRDGFALLTSPSMHVVLPHMTRGWQPVEEAQSTLAFPLPSI